MASLGPVSHVGQPLPPLNPHVSAAALPPHAASPSLLSKSSAFLKEHQRAVLLSAGALAVAGGAYYYYSASATSGKKGKGGGAAPDASSVDLEKGSGLGGSSSRSGSVSGASKKKKKKSSSAKKEEPLLREYTPEELAENARKEKAAAASSEATQTPARQSDDDLPDPTESEIAAMSREERQSLSDVLKGRGNALFAKKDYPGAISAYSRAIAITPQPSAIFHSNRAASYNSLVPPRLDEVVKDCDRALELDPTYLKALKRRAIALDSLGRFEDSVADYTALTLLESLEPPKSRSSAIRDGGSAENLEKILKKMAERKAQTIIKERAPQLPSSTFINAYLDAFRPHALPELPESPAQSYETLKLAYDALAAGNYPHAFTLASESLSQGLDGWPQGKAEALNLRGTFRFLINDRDGAKEDFEQSIALWPALVQSRVKLASVHMELGNLSDTIGDFEAAIKQDSQDPDIYYHRGQVYFITGELDKALADYERSTELDDNFIFSHIQRAVTQYRMEKTSAAMATFRNIIKRFSDRSEPYNYYGELLLAEGRYQDALDKFDKAISIEEAKTSKQNVLPLVNKGNCVLRFTEDFAGCEALIERALSIDPECDVAIITLAQISLQQSKIERAVEMFGRARAIARTEEELVQAITFEEASRAQITFIKRYPEVHAQMTAMMQAQQGGAGMPGPY